MVDIFENGATADLINGRATAYSNQAKDTFNKIAACSPNPQPNCLDLVLQAGSLLLDGLSLVGEFILAGVRDLLAAIGSFFDNFVSLLGDVFNVGTTRW